MTQLPFSLGDRIGKGSFATVYRAETARKHTVAVKVVHRAHLKRDKRLLDNFEAEMAILKQMKHPHIVSLADVVQTDADFYLVMEYCSLGDLSYFMRKRAQLTRSLPLVASMYERYPVSAVGGLNEVVVRHFICQLSAALKFLRRFDLVHRDIKPQNMLLMPPMEAAAARDAQIAGLWELPVLKVADFGFARFLPSTSMAETLCGSPLYMAPEILNYEKYNALADLWSVGAVVYEMVATRPPFPAANHLDLCRKIEKAKDVITFPEGAELSPELRGLICSLLKRSPSQRLSFEEFFAHPVMNVRGTDEQLDLSLLDDKMHISEYLRSPTSPASPPRELYNSNPFSSSDESIKELKGLVGSSGLASPRSTGRTASAGSALGTLSPSTPAATQTLTRQSSPSTSEYVVVEKRTVEVNSLADDLSSPPVRPPAFSRRRLSSITYGTSPTNALAQALLKSSARLFGTQMPQELAVTSRFRGAASVSASGDATPLSPSDSLVHSLDRLNRMGRVVAVFAEQRQQQSHDELHDIAAQEALALYVKALNIFSSAMKSAAKWWHAREENTASAAAAPPHLTEIVQSIRLQFNDAIDKAEAVRAQLLNEAAPPVERLLFERALELARTAAAQELSDDVGACEMNYATALWMLRAIGEEDPSGREIKADDRELVDRLSNKIQQRIIALRRRVDLDRLSVASATSGRSPESPARTP